MKTTNIKSESGKISLWEKLSYSGGDVASCITFGAVSSYLSYYYTDIAGISIAAVGVIFGVTRLLEALVNFLTGVAIDGSHFNPADNYGYSGFYGTGSERTREGDVCVYYLFIILYLVCGQQHWLRHFAVVADQ